MKNQESEEEFQRRKQENKLPKLKNLLTPERQKDWRIRKEAMERAIAKKTAEHQERLKNDPEYAEQYYKRKAQELKNK